MKSLANWLVVMFMFMYWVFRIIVAYMYSTARDFIATPLNFNLEIIILFVTLFCMIFMIARKKLAAIVYAGAYFMYFGFDLFNKLMPAIETGTFSSDMFFSAIAVILAVLALIDILIDKVKAPVQVETDWFYENKDYDRKMDDRVDRNQYRT